MAAKVATTVSAGDRRVRFLLLWDAFRSPKDNSNLYGSRGDAPGSCCVRLRRGGGAEVRERGSVSPRENAMEKQDDNRMGGGQPEERPAKDVARLYAWVNADHGAYQDFSRLRQRRFKNRPAAAQVRASVQGKFFPGAFSSESCPPVSASRGSEVSRAVLDLSAGRKRGPISPAETGSAATGTSANLSDPPTQPSSGVSGLDGPGARRHIPCHNPSPDETRCQ